MTIQEQAQQLAELAEQVPQGQNQAIIGELNALQQQVTGILGDTSGAQEIQGMILQAIDQINNVSAALEQVKQTMLSRAQYHQQG